MIKNFIPAFILLFTQTIFAQLNDYSIKYGIQGHLLIPNTEFKNDAYILSLLGRGFLKYELAPSLETEFGVGIANLAGEDKVKEKWEAYLIPADLRFSFSPFAAEVYSPFLYAGIGLLRWNVIKLPKDEVSKKSGWNSFIPIGAGVEFKLSSDLILDISGGYNFTSTDYLNNYNNQKSNDGYFNFGFGFTFVEGGGLMDDDNDGLSRNFEEEIGTNPNNNDSDNDLLTDGDEVLKYKTDPLKKDTDDDLLSDYDEVKKYLTDPHSKDTDGDNLSDSEEALTYRTEPNNKDTDDDKLSDGNEVIRYKTNPTMKDTDQDGLDDFYEINISKTDPNKKDTDDDGVSDGKEVNTLKTDPLKKETHNDSVKDMIFMEPKPIIKDSETSKINDDLNLNKPVILAGVKFKLGSAELNSQSEQILNKTLNALKLNPDLQIEVRGYTDNSGDAKYNLVLSENRALAVKEWYVKNEIDFRRIKAKGLGEANPVGDNKTEIGREMNRRIEIIKIN